MTDKNDKPETTQPLEDKYLEIEHKWTADHVDWDAFVKFFRRKRKKLKNEEIVTGPDQYWRGNRDTKAIAREINEKLFGGTDKKLDPVVTRKVGRILTDNGVGQSVVRFRSSGKNFNELTVKRRTSSTSTKTREEADLPLKKVSARDVEAFLTMLGYKQEVVLVKRCHIFWVENDLGLAVPVIYDIWVDGKEDEIRRFVEVEAEKGQPKEQCNKILEFWAKELKENFGLKRKHQSDLSLYEIYSGRKYWEADGWNDEDVQ